ncbi:hypothetical protein ACFLZT_04735 [Thermodesulfobacteriota bacterium]
MREETGKKVSGHDFTWIISRGQYTKADISNINGVNRNGTVMEYNISELARYMLNPNPIEVKKKLIGLEIHFQQPPTGRIIEKMRRLIFRGKKEEITPSETVISDHKERPTDLKDNILESHVNSIYSSLRSYDPVQKRLLKLDRSRISDITGLCEEDIDNNHSKLTIKGSIDEKIEYICNSLGGDVGVILEKAYATESLFEMRGFDFAKFNPDKSYRLIKFMADGTPKACVTGPENKVEYWVEDIRLVNFMHLLEQAIQTNSSFKESFKLCFDNKAKPLRLLFNRKLGIDYSMSSLPKTYREIFDVNSMGLDTTDYFIDLLKNQQMGITFQYIPRSDSGEQRLYTNITVMHDFRALEPLKNDLPQVYEEINKKVSVSEAGKYYLLDSIKGYKNEQ